MRQVKSEPNEILCPEPGCVGFLMQRRQRMRNIYCNKCGIKIYFGTEAKLRVLRKLDPFGQWIFMTKRRPLEFKKGKGFMYEYGVKQWEEYCMKHPEKIERWQAEFLGDLL